MKFEWEQISLSPSGGGWTHRSKVKGGWIVQNTTLDDFENNYMLSESMIFIQDPNHEWIVEE